MPETRLAMPETRFAMPETRLAMPETRLAMPETRFSMPEMASAQCGASRSARIAVVRGCRTPSWHARGVRPRALQITDDTQLPESELVARIASVASLPADARAGFAVQLRDPQRSGEALFALGRRLRDATRAVGARLVVNDRLDLAIAIEADGVHLGRRSVAVADARALLGPSVWISVACHCVDDVARAASEGADAALLSPIFASPGKASPLGLDAITDARRAAPSIAILALGGVTREVAPACFARGASGVAAIRADLARVLLDGLSGPC
jgi:thiamine-phosphate pyrophosphorylase